MPLERKKVEGCARAARRSNEVDDIRKDDVVAVVWFLGEQFRYSKIVRPLPKVPSSKSYLSQ